jgi:hypothetical protein
MILHNPGALNTMSGFAPPSMSPLMCAENVLAAGIPQDRRRWWSALLIE